LCDDGVCRQRTEVAVDWVTECVEDGVGGPFVQIENLAAGTYRVNALPSAGAFSDDQDNWHYHPECNDAGAGLDLSIWDFEALTPALVHDQTSMLSVVRTFTGGALVCQHYDSACGDNHGDNSFQLDLLCPGEF
jgi:hypothetical protein